MAKKSEKPKDNGVNRLQDSKTGKFLPNNPGGGRPKGSYSIVELIKKKLQEIPEGKDKTYGEYFVEQVMKKSVIEGDVQMMKDVLNRVDGMPKQPIDHTTDGKELPAPILNYVCSNNGNKEDIKSK